ncbi:LysR family transcriptional regulator [Streptomyces specialis]|uniref:LysR family transcriptional regulator n=1 Tax=Streptomyces specialis TaxID=498367 RepID=UPI00073F33D2|nr:LysR family transcriptional regulator [Streptomyces specialis]
MELGRLDLNLLVPLDALLRERGVTRAAARLGLSQPALSASLRRLRRHFNDELLVRKGNSYVLSPFAVQLRHRLTEALGSIENVFAEHPSFDPGASTREYRIIASDYAISMIGGRLVSALSAVAPHARVRFSRWDLVTALVAGTSLLDDIDGLMLPHGFVSEFPYLDLFADTWTGLVAVENRSVGDALTLEQVSSLPWVVAFRDDGLASAAERTLRLQGIELNVTVVVDNFMSMPDLVADSDRVALVPTRLAHRASATSRVRMVALPRTPPTIIEAFWWHRSRTGDPEHTWLRGLVQDVAASLEPAGAPAGTGEGP